MHGQQFFTAVELFEVVTLELVDLEALAREGFYHAHAAQVLLQGGRQHRILFLIRFIDLGDALKEVHRGGKNHRDGDDRDPCQFCVEIEQHGKVDHKQHDHAAKSDSLI